MSNGYEGSEAVAEELGGEEVGDGQMEVDTSEDHQVVSNEQGATQQSGRVAPEGSGEGEAGGGDSEAAPEAAETDFETGTEWSPDDRFPQESAGEEATVDAYFAEATTQQDAQEFLPILGALLPVIKAALPVLIGTFARQGGAALQGALQARLRRMQTSQPVRRRETAETADGGVSEADLEAFATAVAGLEVIIGRDDRRRISNTTVQPWRRICHLRIRAATGQSFLGTGFFVGRRTIVTAGHCVYLRDSGGWASQIEVTPARNAAQQPYGVVRATSFRSVRGWTNGRKRSCDYGAIILPPSFSQTAIGAFGFAAYTDSQIKQSSLNLAGYPGDKPPGTMWYHGRVAKSVSANVIQYDIDTMGGQSGSPVWQRRNGTRTAVAIHTNGAAGGNSATRITRLVYNNLLTWRQEGEAAPSLISRVPGAVRPTGDGVGVRPPPRAQVPVQQSEAPAE